MTSLLAFFQSLLPVVLSASLSAAALVLVVQLIVWLGHRRLPPRWCHAMWLLVFARLSLPALPEVPHHITPPKPTPSEISRYIARLEPSVGALNTPLQKKDVESPIVSTAAPSVAPTPSLPVPPATVAPASTALPHHIWNWLEIAALIWGAVAAGMLSVMTVAAWQTLRRLRRASVPAPEHAARV